MPTPSKLAAKVQASPGGGALINADKPHRWRQDIRDSVSLYNEWFLRAAPEAYRNTRSGIVAEVESAFHQTSNMSEISPRVLRASPAILRALRMSTAPPIARDRLVGLAYTTKTVVYSFEEGKIPPRVTGLDAHLDRICAVLTELLDLDLFDWIKTGVQPDARQWELARVVVGDRLCGAVTDPIVRNAQEQRQLALIAQWLDGRGYVKKAHPSVGRLQDVEPGTYSFRQIVVVGDVQQVIIPIDVVIQPHSPRPSSLPVLIEAKSAGDFTNPNKRRKEEATKIRQLLDKYGSDCSLLLFLCGYFDAGYLGYEAAEGLDWVWEHRIDDLAQAGI
jgi:XamI restriction endonuclease